MIGKKVRVYWPVDGKWYQTSVDEYDNATKEHKLRYEDGDTEFVQLGTNSTSQTKEKKTGVTKVSENNDDERSKSRGSTTKAHFPPPAGYPAISPYYMDGPYPIYHAKGMFDQSKGPYAAHLYPYHTSPISLLDRVSPDKRETSSQGDSPPKRGTAKSWTVNEDAELLRLVRETTPPLKWSRIAISMPGRSGKQCRERYVNHLNPRLKNCEWSMIEDATIFHLYNKMGSQWANISKMIPGRTDNAIKNRFHNLRRQCEREDQQRMRLSKASDFKHHIHLDQVRELPKHLWGNVNELWDINESVGVLAAQSIVGANAIRSGGRFGPFRPAILEGEQCIRCGLFAPSTHCGTEICTKSGWCLACTRLPPHLCSNILRECLRLRKSEEPHKQKFILK